MNIIKVESFYDKVYKKAEPMVKTGDIIFVVGNSETLVNAVQKYSRQIQSAGT